MTEMLPDAIPDPDLDNPLPDDREAGDGQPDHGGGAMIALKVPDPDLYAVPDGTQPDDLHVTLVYLGKANELSPEQKQAAVQAAQEAAARFGRPPQALFPYDYGTFDGEAGEGSPYVLHPMGDDLDELYGHVCNSLKEHGLGDKIAADHPFNPHVTVKYLGDGEDSPHPDYSPPDMSEVSFPTMRVSLGDDEHPISLAPTAERPIRPQQVLFSVEERLHNLVQDHNLTASRGRRASLPMLKAVYSREFQDARPCSSQSLTAAALRRCTSFLDALSTRNARHPDADLFPCAVPPTQFDRTLTAAVETGSDRIKARLLDSAVSADPAERLFNLSRALHAAASSTNPSVTFQLTEPLRALLADGQSSAARSMRAKMQLRDRHGRWIDMGKGIRFKVHAPGAPGSGTWYHGTVEGQDVPNGNLSVRLEDGRLVQVPADKVEQPLAILGLQGEHLNRTPDPQLDANAPAVPTLHEVSSPDNAQDSVGAGEIRQLLDRVQTRVHDDFRDNPSAQKDPVARMMQAVGQATRDLQNPNTDALDQASSWIDQFLRDNPNLSTSARNSLLYAQDTFRNMGPVLRNYHHDAQAFIPEHRAQRTPDQRPRPFRRFMNGRAQDDANVPAAHRGIEPAGERVNVPSIETPVFPDQNGNPRFGEDVRRYLLDDYGINSSFLPGPDGRPDLQHMSLTGDKAHVDAALRDIWGLERDDSGNIHPLPDPSSPDHGDSGVIANIEAAIQAVQAAHPGLDQFAEQLQHELDTLGSNPSPQQLQDVADELDGARQALDIMLRGADPEHQAGIEAARNALDDAATNAWGGARPERLPLNPSASGPGSDAQARPEPINATQDLPNRAIADQLEKVLEALGDMEDTEVPGIDFQNVRDMVNDIIDSHQDSPYPPRELQAALAEVTDTLDNSLIQAGITPDHLNDTQEGALDRFRGQISQANDIANGNIQIAPEGGDGGGTPPPPSEAPLTPEDSPDVKDQFGEDVPIGFNFDQEIRNQGARVQLYNHTASDGRNYQVGVRPQRFGDNQPQYVIRQGTTHNGRQTWHVLGSHDNWEQVGQYFQQVEADNEQHRQGEANRARLAQEAEQEDARIQASHERRVAENVDDAGNPLPSGWTRHLDEANGTYYQDGAGNMVMSTGAPDHALALYGADPVAGGRQRIGIFDNWGGVHTALTAHQREKQALVRSNVLAAAEHNNFNLSDEEKQGILDAPNQAAVREILANNPQYQAMRRRGADAQQADRMQQHERDAYQLDNNFQALIRRVGDMPSAPGTGEDTPDGPLTDEAHRPLPPEWVKLPGDDARIGQMYMGPGGATAYVDTNRPGNPITVGYENQAGEARQVTGLPDWGAVSELLTQVDRGFDPSNSEPLPGGTPDNARGDAAHAAISDMLEGLGVHPDEVARALAEPTGDGQRFQLNQIPEVRQIRREAEIGNPEQQARQAQLDEFLGDLNGAATPQPAGEPSAPDEPAVEDHNARLNRDRETGFRDSLYHNLVQVGVSPRDAGQIYNMRTAQEVKDYVSGLPEVRDVLANVAEQDPDSVNPVDQRNANLLNRGINMVQDLPDAATPGGNQLPPVGDNTQAFLDAADGLDTWLRDRLQLGDDQRAQILDDPTAAIDLIEGIDLVQNLRGNAADGNERAIRDIQQLDSLEQQLRAALEGNAVPEPSPSGGPSVPPSPGPPEGAPGNPNDVPDSGAPPTGAPEAPAIAPEAGGGGAPPGQEGRYHPDGVIRDRNGSIIRRGSRVVSRRDGQDVIGTVVAVQQQPPYARIQWPDGRRQVRAGGRLTVVEPAQVPGFNAPAQPAAPNAPAAPEAPAAPAAPAVPPAAGNALDQAQAIADMHQAGAERGFPLLTDVGSARRAINTAIEKITAGDRGQAALSVLTAISNYRNAMQSPDFGRQTEAYRQDVARRLELAEQLNANLQNEAFPLQRPNAADAIAALVALRQPIPTAAPRGMARDLVHRRYRYGGFALDDAIPLLRNGNLAEAEAKLNRAIWSFRQGNRADLADQVQVQLNALRNAGLAPENAPNPQAPERFGDQPEPQDFIANRFPQGRAPRAAPANTPGVIDPRDSQDGMTHPQAPNPAAVQADYSDWGPRAAEIAQAARVRPSLAAIQAATGQEQGRLIQEAFGGLDGISFGRSGYKIQVTGSASPGRLGVNFTIYDANGRRVGNGSRSMSGNGGQWTAYNAGMSLNRDAQSTGFANALNRYFENWYIANGFHSVTVSAAGSGGYTGGFAWAMNGFGWKDPMAGDPRNALSAMERSTRAGSPEAQVVAQLKARLELARRTHNEALVPTPMELALVDWAPGKTNWVGKTTMKNQSWGGRKVLQPTSVNWQQRQNYEIAKQAEARVSNQENAFNVNRPFANSIADMSAPGLREAGITPVEAENIAKIMRSQNPSAAQLPFSTKRKLSNWANTQAANGNWNSDIENVANTLQNELMADYPKEDTLGVGQALQGFTYAQMRAGNVPGFTVRRLGAGESGINDTFLVTHEASGQVFFVKKDMGIYSPQNPRIQNTGSEAERDINALLRQMNWAGIDKIESHSIDGGENPANPESMQVQHRVGDNLDLVSRPRGAGDIGTEASQNAFRNLAQHDQLMRMLILDGLVGNPDRHGKNFMLGQGSDGKWWLFPIDHGLARTPVDGAERVDPFESFKASIMRGSNYHGQALAEYAQAMGEVNLKNLLRNILADYQSGVSQPGIFKSNDFSGKMGQNITLLERRLDDMVAHLMALGRRRRR